MKVTNTLLFVASLALALPVTAQDAEPDKSLTYPQTVECSAKAAYLVLYTSANPSVLKYSPLFAEVESKATTLARTKGQQMGKDLQAVGADIRRTTFEVITSIRTAEGELLDVRHRQIEQDVWKYCVANGLATLETLARVTK